MCKIVDSNSDEFPINLDEVWPLAYAEKGAAVRALKNGFIEDVDYKTIDSLTKREIGSTRITDYYITVSCLEYLIARKHREVFEIYRRVFHAARKGEFLYTNQQTLLQDRIIAARFVAEFLNLNDSSKLLLAKSIAEPLGLPTPDYVPSKGVMHSAKELLKLHGIQMSVQALNKALAKVGILKRETRNGRSGTHKWYVITDSGSRFGENHVCPQNPKQTQPLWYDNLFSELVSVATTK